jgi:hypothetical protein
MRNFTPSDKNILIYRIIFTLLSWFIIFSGAFTSVISYGSILNWLSSFKSFTIQTNVMVTIWFTLAIIWHNKPGNLDKINGILKGAFTLYITITFIFFAILLSPFYQPTGFAAFSNLILHYVTPIAFILDWVLTETKMRYKWNFLLYWIIYPISYLVFALLHDIFTGIYIYFFLDVSEFGILTVLIVFFLVASGMALGCLYIAINRKRTQS